MEITAELVLELYRRRDPKRKRMLYELCRDLFEGTYSSRFLAEMINKRLSAEIITLYEIKYIRSKMKRWAQKQGPQTEKPEQERTAVASKPARWSVSEAEPYVKPFDKFKQ